MPSAAASEPARGDRPAGPSPRSLRLRSTTNLLRMGHCAPCIMQTLLDASETRAEWLVRLTAGLPGGIGNTGGECGGVTAPLVLLGLRYGRGATLEGLPVVIHQGHALLRRFAACNGTLLCRRIRGDRRLPLRCIGVIRSTPELYVELTSTNGVHAIAGERLAAYRRLHAHLAGQGFHCAHAVFRRLDPTVPVTPELLDATSGFVGGTVYSGRTCSALTAGVMALGLALGEIEHRPLRVLRMIGTMVAGGDAFADHLNAFNRIMNLGHRLAEWFAAEFGSTQCRTITNGDFAATPDVTAFIDGGCAARCDLIARGVAGRVREMIERDRGGAPSATAPAG